jgi:hypothetical protein
MEQQPTAVKPIVHYKKTTRNGVIITECGKQLQASSTPTFGIVEAVQTPDYEMCPLCELAWEMRDVRIPRLEQGELW